MIKYKSAYDFQGKIVTIDNVKRDENEEFQKYTCISCGAELITKMGNVKIHHFAHKQTINCNGETYLHNLGKRLFFDEYTTCLGNKTPFTIQQYREKVCNCFEKEFGKKCYLDEELVSFNLTSFFDEIEMEKKDSDFIPDLKLKRKNATEVIYIEIAVTHLSTEKKLNSKNRIIELKVDEESDLDVIKQHKLSIENSKLLFKNFDIKKIEGNFCNGKCKCFFDLFLVFKSGKSVLLTLTLSEISSKLKRFENQITYNHISRSVEGNDSKFKYLIAKAYTEKVFFKNCYICRYHGETRESFDWLDSIEYKDKPIFCKTFKKHCGSNEATSCDRFRVEQKHISFHLQAGEDIMTLVDRDEPHEDYYTENEHRLHKEFWEKHNSGEFY